MCCEMFKPEHPQITSLRYIHVAQSSHKQPAKAYNTPLSSQPVTTEFDG
jgi:hypothetical protein